MGKTYSLQFIRAPRPCGLDEADLPWEAVAGHDDYTDEAEAWAACAEFDAAFDHMFIHRVKPQNDNQR